MTRVSRRAFLALSGFALAGLAGCSQDEEPSKQNEPATAEATEEAEPSPLEVSECGFYTDEYGTVHYAAIVTNPNMDWSAERISTTASALDEGGNVIDTANDSITLMFENGKTAISGTMMPNAVPASISVQVSVGSNGWSKQDVTMDEFYSNLYVDGLNESVSEYGTTTFAGTVVNNLDGSFSLTRINIVIRDAAGAIVGGAFTYVNGELAAGATAPFSADARGVPEHASIEAYVDCGYPVTEQ